MKTLQLHFRIIFTMIHEDLLKSVMYVINGTHTYRKSAAIYHVPNRKILQVVTEL